MSDEFSEPSNRESYLDEATDKSRSGMRILFFIVLIFVLLCCCCFAGLAALYYGTEPAMDLLGIPIPW